MLNKVILMGRLTTDPELRTTPKGDEVISFTIAVERSFADANGDRKADFLNCVAWKGTARFIHSHFNKGQMINVCGSLQTRNWDDAQGQKRYSTEVSVSEANFCGDKPKTDPLDDVEKAVRENGFVPVCGNDDDVPF